MRSSGKLIKSGWYAQGWQAASKGSGSARSQPGPLLLRRRRRLAGTLGALEARRRRASDLHEFGRHPREVVEQLATRVPDRVGVALQRAQALLGLLAHRPRLLLRVA